MILTQEQEMIRDSMRAFAQERLAPFAAEWDKHHTFPAEALKELGELMDARDAGKLNVKEYCRLCFELDKKYGLADEEDAELYLGEEEPDTDVENDFDAPLTFVGA